ncbi:MAG TPA: AAA family ATPase, partial [Nitrososphaeraceae archaeon]|nr:AAA family ATPase [Nitrososphaeraceae archaeon]
TIFVGHNGSGKSSIIDAITFALFGEHTRKTNKNLILRGASSSYVRLIFYVNSREYSAYRQLGSLGQSISAKLDLLSDSNNIVNKPIVAGERKQFGESMSAEVAKTLGIDYKKLKVATIIQQGELNRIIEFHPKDFKELLNGMIGIDRLDLAYQTMHETIDGFRERLRTHNNGFDDKQIESIRNTIQLNISELLHAESILKQLESERNRTKAKLHSLEKEIERIEPLILKARELQTMQNSLIEYLNEKKDCLSEDIIKLDRIVKEAQNSIQIVSEKEEIKINLQMVRSEVEDAEIRIINNEGEFGRLKGLLEFARKIEIKDGKCPVCNSTVQTVNKILDTGHIKNEMKKKTEERSKLLTERINSKKEESFLEEKEKRIAAAEKFLALNNICNLQDIIKLEKELFQKKNDLSKLPKTIVGVDEDARIFMIDHFSKSMVENIIKLKYQVKDLRIQDYLDAKLNHTRLSDALLEINMKIGSSQKSIQQATKVIDDSNKILTELDYAAKYITILEKIRATVFNRDGLVGLSLRSWALKTISFKASEYATMFNIGISRIDLAEKVKDVDIICYGRHGEIDINSLSGGEKVAVALALRFAISYMMGSGKLDFIILDEPTAHLDTERRKSMVKIISEAFKDGDGPLSQIIIITHDAEIFEDSEVDRIYRFTMSVDGSVVSTE